MANTKSIALLASSSQSLSISDANQTGLDLLGNFSSMFWIQINTNPGVSEGLWIFSKWGALPAYGVQYQESGGSYYLRAINSDGTVGVSSKAQSLTLGTWYHIAVTFELSTGIAEYFVNGSSIGTNTGLRSSNQNSTDDFQLSGQYNNGTRTQFLNCKLDEFGIYDTVLSSATISADYNSGNGTERSSTETGIVAGWRFEDDLLDVTTNNNDLTNNNSATFSTDVPFVGSTATTDNALSMCNF